MKELVTTHDPVFLSWFRDVLAQEGIESFVLDAQVNSLFPGSMTVAMTRVMVREEDFYRANLLLDEAREEHGEP